MAVVALLMAMIVELTIFLPAFSMKQVSLEVPLLSLTRQQVETESSTMGSGRMHFLVLTVTSSLNQESPML